MFCHGSIAGKGSGRPTWKRSFVKNIIRLILSVIIPPLGVLLKRGLGGSFILSIILTLLGYVPGLIYAFVVVLGDDKK